MVRERGDTKSRGYSDNNRRNKGGDNEDGQKRNNVIGQNNRWSMSNDPPREYGGGGRYGDKRYGDNRCHQNNRDIEKSYQSGYGRERGRRPKNNYPALPTKSDIVVNIEVSVDDDKSENKYLNVVNELVPVENKPLVDVTDPDYWNGPFWMGPKFMRVKKTEDSETGHAPTTRVDNLNETRSHVVPSTVVVMCRPIEFSRDGEKWYNSFDNTFTHTQLAAMEHRKQNDIMETFLGVCRQDYARREMESYNHYIETGGEDLFARAERESHEYDEYVERMEVEMKEYVDECDEVEQYFSDEYSE